LLSLFYMKTSEVTDEVMRCGMKEHSRHYYWRHVSGALELEARFPNLYTTLLLRTSESRVSNHICADVPRTFSFDEGVFGSEKESALRNVLVAYANFDKDIRYVQGMSYVASILLLNMEEEAAFWVLVALMKQLSLDCIYTPQNFWTEKFDEIGLKMYPKLFHCLHQRGIQSELYLPQWFRTFFLYSENIELAIRMMDSFLVFGIEGLYRVGYAILLWRQSTLLEAQFMEIVNSLTHLKDIVVDEVFHLASTIPFPQEFVIPELIAFRQLRSLDFFPT